MIYLPEVRNTHVLLWPEYNARVGSNIKIKRVLYFQPSGNMFRPVFSVVCGLRVFVCGVCVFRPDGDICGPPPSPG